MQWGYLDKYQSSRMRYKFPPKNTGTKLNEHKKSVYTKYKQFIDIAIASVVFRIQC